MLAEAIAGLAVAAAATVCYKIVTTVNRVLSVAEDLDPPDREGPDPKRTDPKRPDPKRPSAGRTPIA
jgi:hypothetical protein